MAFTGQRWIGRALPAPCQTGHSSAGGRHTYYDAVGLADACQEVKLNDVVQICRPAETSDGIPRLAQVLSMWEDAFTGECKFRARWLVHSSSLPKDALSRFRAAHERFEENGMSNQDATRPDGGPSSPETDENNYFLTAKQEDLLVAMITKPVTICVAGTPLDKAGLRLTSAFDDTSGDFTPLEGTDPIVARALARQAEEAVAPASRGSDGTTVSDWLLPKGAASLSDRGGGEADDPVGGVALSSARDTETEEDSSDGDSMGAEDPVSVGVEDWDQSEQGDDEGAYESSQGGEIDANSSAVTPQHASVGINDEEYAAPTKPDLSGGCQRSPGQSNNEMSDSFTQANAAPAPPHGSSGVPGSMSTESSLPARSRRLAMPPAEGDAASPTDANTSPLNPANRYSMRARQSVGIGGRGPQTLSLCETRKAAPASSKRLLSGKRKRATKPAEEGSESEDEYPPRRTAVGDEFQVDIPDLLPAEEREKATGSEEESGAKMVWRSIRDWDPHTRGVLVGYLQAAKAVVRTKQSRPGIAVHIRMGGKNSDESTTKNAGRAESFAAWALTATPGRGTSASGTVRIACPANAQTEVPASAIQRVQYEEEALEALHSTTWMLEDFEPALLMLADNKMSLESLQPWTLHQVGILEAALERDFDPDGNVHGVDREDSIDLTKIIKEIPGKSPGQVLYFYYRYLAAARPLIDLVYGAEAAKTRKGEVFAGGDSDVEMPVAPRRGLARSAPTSSYPNGDRKSMTNRNSLAAGVLVAGAPPLGFRVGSTGADRAGELRHAGTAETRAELLPRGAEAGDVDGPNVGDRSQSPTPIVRGPALPIVQSGQKSPSLWQSAPGPVPSSLDRPGDDLYGFMAPCWRLLERAQPYVNQDQLLYLEGLIFRHLEKPLPRRQLLERVKSCLDGQQGVYAAFARMFDRVEENPIMPPPFSAKMDPDGPPSEGGCIPLTPDSAYAARFFPRAASLGVDHMGPHQWPVPPHATHGYGYGATQGKGGSLFHPPPPVLPPKPSQGRHDASFADHEHDPHQWGGGAAGRALTEQEKPSLAPAPPGPAWEGEGVGASATKL